MATTTNRSSGSAASSGDISPPVEERQILGFLEVGGLGGRPTRIDTHGAHIFLLDRRAYKIKRWIHYSFMDFSTPEKREAAIRAELALNARTAPELYRRVLPITLEADGSLALEGCGRAVEWVLEMARFDEAGRLDHVAERGELTPAIVERLAMAIADLHEKAEFCPERGGAAAMRRVTDGNAADLRELATILPVDRAASLASTTDDRLQGLAPLLDARRATGKVRRCHGDLHLANIVLLEGDRPVLFDCLEFDEELASIDIVYDLAFLLMDLLRRGLGELAQRCLQAWNDRLVEDEGLALLPLSIAVRATIRAKIDGFSARLETSAAGRQALTDAALGYLELAEQALSQARPRLIAIGGLSGTGKTTLARALAPSLLPIPGAIVLRSDVIRKVLHGVTATERLPPSAYTPEVSARVFASIRERAAALLRAGYSVICDGVYGRTGERHEIEQVAKNAGVRFDGVWLDADPDRLVERVSARVGDASDADAGVVRRQLSNIETAEVRWHRLDARVEPSSLATVARAALES